MMPNGGQTARRAAESLAKRSAIMDAVLAGKDQREIGAAMGITQQAVSKHVIAAIKDWRNSLLCKTDQYIANELLRINYAESQCWKTFDQADRAWRKSMGLVKVVTKKAKAVPVYADGKPVMVNGEQQTRLEPQAMEAKEETKVGNPAFLKAKLEALAQAMACAGERRKLLGLDQPQKFKLQFPTLAEIEGMTDDQLVQTIATGAVKNPEVFKYMLNDAAALALITAALQQMPGNGGNGNGNGTKPN